jgi:hypothetical protein
MRTWSKTTITMILILVLAGCASPDEAPIDAAAEPPAAESAQDAPVQAEPEEEGSETEPASEEAVDLEITAYVVSYHWGWAVFDEDGNELDALNVPVGTTVELVAVNDHATMAINQLPAPVAETIRGISWHDRAHHAVMEGRIPDPEDEEGITMSEALKAAHDGHSHHGPAQDHGLMVTGVGVQAFLDAHAHEPERLVFTVNREGAFEFRCTEECGFGHDYQRWEMLFVG